jgi:hypothetical protein
MSQKRREFLKLLAAGWSMRAACQELGTGRSTGHIWKNGTVVRRKDGTAKVVPPLEPLAVRTISLRFLSEQERIQIADLACRGHGPTAIGEVLGRSPSTISRELRRNLHTSGQWRLVQAREDLPDGDVIAKNEVDGDVAFVVAPARPGATLAGRQLGGSTRRCPRPGRTSRARCRGQALGLPWQ